MSDVSDLLRKPDNDGLSVLFVGGPMDGEIYTGYLKGPIFSVNDAQTDYQLLIFKTYYQERKFNTWVAVPTYWGETQVDTVSDILASHLQKVLESHGCKTAGEMIFLEFKPQPWNKL